MSFLISFLVDQICLSGGCLNLPEDDSFAQDGATSSTTLSVCRSLLYTTSVLTLIRAECESAVGTARGRDTYRRTTYPRQLAMTRVSHSVLTSPLATTRGYGLF